MFGQTITVKIKYADFRIVTRSRTMPAPVITREQLHEVSVALVRSIYPVSWHTPCWGERIEIWIRVAKAAKPGLLLILAGKLLGN